MYFALFEIQVQGSPAWCCANPGFQSGVVFCSISVGFQVHISESDSEIWPSGFCHLSFQWPRKFSDLFWFWFQIQRIPLVNNQGSLWCSSSSRFQSFQPQIQDIFPGVFQSESVVCQKIQVFPVGFPKGKAWCSKEVRESAVDRPQEGPENEKK